MSSSFQSGGDDHFQFQNLSFTHKLFDILSDERNRDIIAWNKDGDNFEVLDPKSLEKDILPRYFRHSRFQSLVRQLNFYSFKKVGKERSSWVYSHEFFKRGQPELLSSLKRKTNLGGMVHRPNPSTTRTFIKPAPSSWRANSSEQTLMEVDSNEVALRSHRDSFDTTTSRTLSSDTSTLSDRDPDDEEEEEADDEHESLDAKISNSVPSAPRTPLPVSISNTRLPLYSQVPPVMMYHPLCSLQQQSPKPNICVEPRIHMGKYIAPFSPQTPTKSHLSSPKSSMSSEEESNTDFEEIETQQQESLFSNKATESLMNILEQRSLRLDQFNAIILFLHHLLHQQNTMMSPSTPQPFITSEIFHFLALYPELSYEIALYMQALNCSIESLPFFKSEYHKQKAALLSRNFTEINHHSSHENCNYSKFGFIFGGDLNACQVKEIITHFIRYLMNLLQDITEELDKLTSGANNQNKNSNENENEKDDDCCDACQFFPQFSSFQKDIKENIHFLQNQFDLLIQV